MSFIRADRLFVLVLLLLLGSALPSYAQVVEVTKTVSGTFVQGTNITYTVVLTNLLPHTQNDNFGHEFVDILPAGLTLVPASFTSTSGTMSSVGNIAFWDASIPSGGTVTITFQATINPLASGQICNQGQSIFDGDNDGNSESSELTDDPSTAAVNDPTCFYVVQANTVSATKTVSGTFVQGTNVTYTIVMTNNMTVTQGDNLGSEFADVVPSALMLVSANATSGTAVSTIATNTVTWNGSIPSGGTVTLTIVATIHLAATGTISNQGQTIFDRNGDGLNESSQFTDDPSTAAPNDATSFTVIPQGIVGATKTAAGTFRPGSTVTYTVALSKNAGFAQANNPGSEFTDVLPSALILVSANATSGTAVANVGTNTVTWNGSIAAGGTVTITIQATVNNTTAPGIVVSNQGTIAFDTDNNATNESASSTDDPGVAGSSNPTNFTVVSPATVTAIKTVAGQFRPGGAIAYTVTLTNAGSAAQFDNAGNEFVDILPAALTLVSANATIGTAVATIATKTVTWSGSIAVGASVTITINATVDSATALNTVVSNQGTINYDADGNGTNEATNVTDDPGIAGASNPTSFTVLSPASLTGAKTVSGSFRPGTSVTYTVVLTNAGPAAQFDNAGNEFTDVLPATLTLVSANATSGTAVATIATNTVTWNGSLANGASVTITINATVVSSTALATVVSNQGTINYDADGNGTNEATNVSDNPGTGAANDPTSFTVSSPATVTATKTVAGSFNPGGAITYTVILTNTGSGTQFDNVGNELTDVLPAALTLVGANATSGTAVATVATNTVTWNGSLANGATATITINATIVSSTAPGAIVSNQGTASFDADGNGTNEASALTDDPGVSGAANPTIFTVVSPASVTATKTVTGVFRPGQSITYTVVLTNGGPAAQFDNAGNEFTDVLPAALTLVSANATSGTATATVATNTVTWNGSLANGASVTITISATIGSSTPLATMVSNQGTASFDADGNGSNEASALTDDPGVAGAANPTNFTVASPATVTATKIVGGSFNPSGSVTYTVVLTNTASASQFDNPGNEFTDVLPSMLTLVSASATQGSVATNVATRTVTWDGTITNGQSVTITINATISPTAGGAVVVNQGTVSYDADGNGTNEASALTDDPTVAGAANPTTFTVNAAPTISAIPDATIAANSVHVVNFTIGDDTTAPAALSVTAESSNPSVVPPLGLQLTGTGASRTLTVTPIAAGMTTITVRVGDGSQTTSEPLVLTVNAPPPPPPPPPPANTAPTLSGVADSTIEETKTLTLTLTVADEETAASALVVTASSTNAALLPITRLVLDGSGTTRTLTMTPVAERTGQATVNVTVSDGGGGSTTRSMLLAVIESPPPLPPTGLTATAVGNDVTLTWVDPVTGATPTFYVLEGGSAPGATTLPVIFTLTRVTRWTLNLPPGVYFFRVRAANRKGTSVPSNEATTGVTSPVVPPGPPTGLAATIQGAQVTLGWQPSIAGGAAQQWQVELGAAPGAADRGVFILPQQVTSVSGTLEDGEYFARVRGGNGAGLGPASNETRFRIGAVPACDAPETPVLLPATVNGPVVTLSWRASRNVAVGNYRLMIGSVPGASDLAILDVGTVTSFRVQAPPGRYSVALLANNNCGTSNPSNAIEVNVVTAEPTPAPANLRAVVNGSQVGLAWDAVSVATSYLLEAGYAPGLSNAAVLPLSATATGLVVNTVPSGTYYVRVRAIGPGGTSVPSVEIVVVVP